MIQRVGFLAGAVAAVFALPEIARSEPDASPEPAASPAASPRASAAPAPKPKPTRKPHVHGPNGVVSLPEHRTIEWTMDVLDGPPFRLSAYRGKPVFVNVFATWCGPCHEEQPEVVAFAHAHADDVVMIGVDAYEEDNAVRGYRKKYAITYPIAMDRNDRKIQSIFHQGKMVFPTTVVFRADGTLSCAWAGGTGRAFFERELEYALQEPPS